MGAAKQFAALFLRANLPAGFAPFARLIATFNISKSHGGNGLRTGQGDNRVVLFLSIFSGLVSVAATYFWFQRYISGRTSERICETLEKDPGDLALSVVAELLPTKGKRILNALVITLCTAFFGLLHWCSVRFWVGPPEILMSCLFYAFTLTMWAAFLMFPARVAGEVLLRYHAAKAR